METAEPGDRIGPARLLAGGQFGGVDHQRQNVFGPRISEPDLAVEAVHALDRFAFVGIAERYELSLQKAYALMELGEPPPPKWINVTPSKPTSYASAAGGPRGR